MSTLAAYTGVILLMNANAFLHYVSKIPGLGPVLARHYFKKEKAKAVVSFLGFFWGFLKAAVGANLTLYFALWWVPDFLTRGAVTLPYQQGLAMTLYVLFFNLARLIGGSKLFAVTQEDNTFLNYFSLNPDKYYRYKSLKEIVTTPLLQLPVLIYIFRDVRPVIFAVALNLFTAALTEVLSLEAYKRFQKILPKRLRMVLQFLIFVGAYSLVYVRKLPTFLPGATAAIILAVAAVVMFAAYVLYLRHYQNFKEIAVNFARKDIATVTVTVTSTLNEGDTGLAAHTPEDNRAFYEANRNLSPVAYIEKAFRTRYAKILKRKTKDMILQQLVTAVILGVLIRLGLLVPDADNWIRYTPIGISFVLMMSYAMEYLTLCFRVVDRVFLAQHLYAKKDMQRNLKQRLGSLFKSSVPRLLAMLAFFAIIALFWGLRPEPILAAQVFLAYVLIYYIYELFSMIAYYALMPFSAELQVKSPLYKVIQFLIGLFGIYFLFARANVIQLLPGLWITLGILLLCLAILYRHIDKTFKLRY